MAAEVAAPVPPKALDSKLGVASPDKSPVKMEHSSSPPPLIDNISGILEDGEIDEKQGAVGSLQGKASLHGCFLIDTFADEPQLSALEYSALEDRYKRLERQ